MSQIQRKKYAAPYRVAGKPVWAIGLSFNGKTLRLIPVGGTTIFIR